MIFPIQYLAALPRGKFILCKISYDKNTGKVDLMTRNLSQILLGNSVRIFLLNPFKPIAALSRTGYIAVF